MLCKEIQSAIEAGRIKFDVPEKPMKIDGHPFHTNMVDVKDLDTKTGPKVLTSEQAKHSGAVVPKAQVLANQLRGQGRYERGESSRRSSQRVRS